MILFPYRTRFRHKPIWFGFPNLLCQLFLIGPIFCQQEEGGAGAGHEGWAVLFSQVGRGVLENWFQGEEAGFKVVG